MLTSSQRQTLACALSLLTSIPHHHPPSLLIEQLTYLVQGQSYLHGEEATSPLPSLPSRPTFITKDLWTHLHSIPLSTAYFSRVIASTRNDSDTKFWAGLEEGKGRGIEEFPWKQGRQEPHVLDDLLLLNLIHEPALLQVISRDTARLTSSVQPLSLSELLITPNGEKRKPLLILHDENQLVCELNFSCLQEELQKIIGVSISYYHTDNTEACIPPSSLTLCSTQDKSLKVMDIASSIEKGVCSSMTVPPAHCLFVTGLCHCDSKWLPLASARLQQTSENGETK